MKALVDCVMSRSWPSRQLRPARNIRESCAYRDVKVRQLWQQSQHVDWEVRDPSTNLNQFSKLDGKRHDCDRAPCGLGHFQSWIESLVGGFGRTGAEKSVD